MASGKTSQSQTWTLITMTGLIIFTIVCTMCFVGAVSHQADKALALHPNILRVADLNDKDIDDQANAKFKWQVQSMGQFYIEPNKPALLSWHVKDSLSSKLPANENYTVADYAGKILINGQVKIDHESKLKISLQLEQGFYTLHLLASDQIFGIICQPTFTGNADPFFCVDSALSWLVVKKNHYTRYPDFEKARQSLIGLLKRTGIAMSRERLSWGQIQKNADQWDWQSPRKFEQARKMYQDNQVPILELFHSTPAFMGHTSGKRFPNDLHAAAKGWKNIHDRWKDSWGGVEIWNEPNIDFSGNQPADQYAPLAKIICYAMNKADCKVPVGGPGVAGLDVNYIKNLGENGVLANMDYFSFHTYNHAPLIEQLVADVRKTLDDFGQTAMPIWITECGRPWSRGGDRPDKQEDMESAMDNVMKAIESKACGIAKHFIFVYPFYEERSRNFGLLDRQGTPLRAMAAYTQAINMLSHQTYLGDWKVTDKAIRLARVFGDKQHATLILYAGKTAEDQSVSINLPASAQCYGIDGRRLDLSTHNRVPIADGLTYVRILRSEITNQINEQTLAKKLTQQANGKRMGQVPPSPIVMQFMPEDNQYHIDVNGYHMVNDVMSSKPMLPVRLVNLDDKAHQVHVTLNAKQKIMGKVQTYDIPAQQSVMTQWEIPKSLADQPQIKLEFQAQSQTAGVIQPVVINLLGEVAFEQLISPWSYRQKLVIDDQTHWQMVAAPTTHAKMNFPGQGIWQMNLQLEKGTDNWAYPRLKINMPIDPKKMQGLIFEAKAINAAAVRIFFWEENQQEKMESVGYLSPSNLFAADGKWHSVYLPFSSMALSGANTMDQNNKLDLDRVKRISIGMNGNPGHVQLQVRQVWLVGQ